MRAAAVLLTLCTIGTYTINASAQETGSRVRVRDGTTEVIGTLVRLGTDSIVVKTDLNAYHQGRLVKQEVAVPVTVDTRLDVSLGRHSKAGKGALIGGGIGLGLALLATATADYDDDTFFVTSPGTVFLMSTALFAVPGSLIGFAIGSGTKWEDWRTVPLDRPPRGDPYEVTEGMVRLGLRVNF